MAVPSTDPEIADEIVATVRRFVERDVLAVANDLEHADAYPGDLIDRMKELGLFGATIPEEHGGLGLDVITYARIVEELSAGWMSLSGAVNTHLIAAGLVSRHGTDDQKARLLPRMATGELRGCLSLSEPDAGSDTSALRCKATPDGEEYVLDGAKAWVTNGMRASVVALAARTPEGITCFVVEKEPGPTFGGISVSKTVGKLGYKGIETVEMAYDGHRVPKTAVLGGESGLGRGLHHILSGLELGRINIAARACGVARAAFEAAMRYSRERETFGKPIGEHQAIQFKLADMATKLEAARLLTRSAAEKYQSGERADVEAGMAKLFASETAFELATESMRIHGGVGYSTELSVERLYRDAPLMIIGEGTNEIQRLVIARGLLSRWQAAHGAS
ncbi:MAG TPA: acyl-CoA dehydrogenase family protein [Acidimicrobiales bacterium]|nr:acyl-CoA dehydrogenase family protein [Acidimicrobiales bacterium]